MKRVIIDTNALMAIGEFGIDIFSALQEGCDFEFSFAVLQGTIGELEKIFDTQNGKNVRFAKLALSLLKAKKVNVIDSQGYVDDVLVELSKNGDLILTQDIGLKKRLHKPYLTIRQRKKIILVE